MTEAEWLAAVDPEPKLEFLRDKASDRKLRLFACACCRYLRWHDPRIEFLRTVETSELFADGATSKAELKRARQSVRAVRHVIPAEKADLHAEWSALWLAEVAASENAFGKVADEICRLVAQGLVAVESEPPCYVLLSDIFGNPFRPVIANPTWLTPSVVALAQTIYDERAFNRLSQLADALGGGGMR